MARNSPKRSSSKSRGAAAGNKVVQMIARQPSMPRIPIEEVMSFLRQTKSAVTWTSREMAGTLKISLVEASRIVDLLALQGYVKQLAIDRQWMTTIDGEVVSGSKPLRFRRERVEKALAELKERMKAVNQNSRAGFHIADAVAFGDFLLEIPRVQAADVGVRLIARK